MNKVGNKKLVIFGAYGGANIGDEVILHAALFPPTKLYIAITSNNSVTWKQDSMC